MIENAFSGDILKSAIPGYSVRPLQVEFAQAVGVAMERGGIHLFEAGTGIGKSLAYIIPAVLSGRKIFISTATITLQDQLAKKDAPAVLSALESNSRVCVLKGRNNYLCLRKWNSGSATVRTDADLVRWAETTEDGDISNYAEELPFSVWRHFRSDHLDCTGSSCSFRGSCHFFKARNQAKKSDILILNHHLLVSGLMADEVLPGADVLVIDEGHRLEDAASSCLGLSLSEGMLLPIFDGIAFSELDTEKKAALLETSRLLAAAITDLTAEVDETSIWDPVMNIEGLTEVQDIARQLVADVEGIEDMLPVAQAASVIVVTAAGFLDISTEEYCCFVETGRKQPVIKGVPLDIGPDLIDTVYTRFDTTILTSATLTVADEFDFFRSRLGAWDAVSKSFGSPFDYASQAVLTIPDNLPAHDSHEDLAVASWQWGRRLAEKLNGRTLMLFTSYRNLKLVRNIASKELPPGLRLYVQGEMSRNSILTEFRESSRGIILGTSSFWEGVDLPGNILQAVIIDRLPFASPGHPLVKARMDLIEKRGGSSFGQYSLPMAAVRLRQGVGRLIRSLDDTGVVMMMDRRLLKKNYGSVFLRSIPPFKVVSEDQALQFAMEHCSGSGVSLLNQTGIKSDENDQ